MDPFHCFNVLHKLGIIAFESFVFAYACVRACVYLFHREHDDRVCLCVSFVRTKYVYIIWNLTTCGCRRVAPVPFDRSGSSSLVNRSTPSSAAAPPAAALRGLARVIYCTRPMCHTRAMRSRVCTQILMKNFRHAFVAGARDIPLRASHTCWQEV